MTLPRITLSQELADLIYKHWMDNVWTGNLVCKHYQSKGWDLIKNDLAYSIPAEQYLQFLFSYAD